MATHPPGFDALIASQEIKNHGLVSTLSRARARYSLAASMKKIELTGFSAALEDGYGHLLRLALAYSVHETLEPLTHNRELVSVSHGAATAFREKA